MHTIQARNVNDALSQAIPYLLDKGVREESRDGPVIVAPGPVVTVYTKPCERVLFSATRNANPFFHMMEALWMLAGHNDLAFPMTFNKNFANYSDDGTTVHGAYGYRWREHFGFDQIPVIVDELKRNPTSRRCVLQMWDAALEDLEGANDLWKAVNGGKDVPCNTAAYFDLRGGVLNMTVCCRSNDVLWGAYGANAVHFSMLQEYLATMIGVPVGQYIQFSNNFHIYEERFSEGTLRQIAEESLTDDYRNELELEPHPLISTSVEAWNDDLSKFITHPGEKHNYRDPFFKDVVDPMYQAWMHRDNEDDEGLRQCGYIVSLDWSIACYAWVERREEKRDAK